MATRFVLIRHGQTEWNQGAERFRGRADVPLNATGIIQAQHIAQRLAKEKITAMYASPMQRTLHTAQPLANALQLPVQPHPGLLDIDFGALEGMTLLEAQAAFPDVMEQWSKTPGRIRFPKGESFRTLRSRINNVLDELTEKHPGEMIALVSHRIVCQAMLCIALTLPADALWRIRMDNGGISMFKRNENSYTLTLLNEISHLG